MSTNFKNKLYEYATLWLTFSLVFFIVEYLTEWMEVVTLGGLVAGSFLHGFFMLLGVGLMALVAGKTFLLTPFQEAEKDALLKAMVIVAAFCWEGALFTTRLLPGYTMHAEPLHLLFLLIVEPLGAIICKKLVYQRSLK